MGIHDLSIYAAIRRNARLFNQKPALIYGQEQVSYSEISRKKSTHLLPGCRASVWNPAIESVS